jgi:hypothetical protein
MSRMRAALCAATSVVALAVVIAPTPAGAQDAPPPPPGGTYRALTPTRILDTRSGLGAPKGATGSATVGTAQVAGIPASGVSAVAVNVTTIGPAAGGYLAAYATSAGLTPHTSFANYNKGQTVPAMTIVPVDATGHFTIFSSAKTQLLGDVLGYVTTPQAATTGGRFTSVTPTRIMDTRTGLGGPVLGANSVRNLKAVGANGVPATGVSAVVVNVIAVDPSATGYVTAYPTGIATPHTSTTSFAAHETRANRAIVPIGAGGQISFFNASGSTQLVVEISGYFTDSPDSAGSYYVARAPYRLVDTSQGTTGAPTWHAAGATGPVGVTMDAPATLTVSALNPATSGRITVYPTGTARPNVADFNAVAGQAVANGGPVAVTSGGTAQLYSAAAFSSSGSRVLVDINGYFVDAPQQPSAHGIWAWNVPNASDAFLNTPQNDVRAIAGHPSLASVLLANGTVVGWSNPSLGGYSLSRRPTVTRVNGEHDVVQLMGGSTTYALHQDGTVTAWGSDSYGEYGDGTVSDTVFQDWDIGGGHTVTESGGQTAIDNVVTIGAGVHVGFAVKSDGTAWAWGRYGNATTPVQIPGLTGITSITGGASIYYAVDSDGRLWRWGTLQRTNGSNTTVSPEQVTGACAVGKSVTANTYGAWELCADGTVWQLDHLGYVQYGQTSFPRLVPTLQGISTIASGPTATGVGAGVQGLDADGHVWRYNPNTDAFQTVYGLAGVTAIGAVGSIAYAGVG